MQRNDEIAKAAMEWDKWYERQDETTKARYCIIHRKYTGANGVLGCKECNK